MTSEPSTPKRRLRFFQFRLWHVLVLLTLVAIPIGIYTGLERSVARQQAAITVVENFGGSVTTKLVGPQWLPEKYRIRVVGVEWRMDRWNPGDQQPFRVDPQKRTKSLYAPDDPFASVIRAKEIERPSAAEFIEALRTFHRLEDLSLIEAGLRDEHVAMFSRKWPLRKLDLTACSLTKSGFENIARFTELESLNLSHSTLCDDDLAAFTKLTQLTNLQIRSTNVTDAGLKHIGEMTNLRCLGLLECKANGSGFVHLKSLQQLQHFEYSTPLREDRISTEGPLDWVNPVVCDFRTLPVLRSLHTLELTGAILNGDSLQAISRQPSLKKLKLLCCRIEPDSLHHLKATPLELLHIDSASLSTNDHQWLDDNPLLQVIYRF